MRRKIPNRIAMAMLLGLALLQCASAVGQLGPNLFSKPFGEIPAAPPSSSAPAPPPAPTTLPTPATPTSATASFAAMQAPAQRPARRPEVSYTQGQLAVKADNASLNQILREIGRQTGIKITGGVAEERVFGKYGPLPPADVLAALLDGTGSNVLLLHSDANSPGELILTPRQGGVTPPNPDAPGFDDEGPASDEGPAPEITPPPPVSRAPAPPVAGVTDANVPAGSQPTSGLTPAAGTNAADPNAVKSPQQIYEQLQRMRQQQFQQPPPQQ